MVLQPTKWERFIQNDTIKTPVKGAQWIDFGNLAAKKDKGRIRYGYQTEFLKWFGFTLIQWIPFGQNLGLWSREYHWPSHGGLSSNRGFSKKCEIIQKVKSGKKFSCWVILGGWIGIVMIHVENPVLSQTGAALEMTQGGFWSLLNWQYEPRELRLRLQFLVVSLFMFDFPSPSGGFHSHGGPPNSFLWFSWKIPNSHGIALEDGPVEIVDLATKNVGSFNSYINVYQRLSEIIINHWPSWIAIINHH